MRLTTKYKLFDRVQTFLLSAVGLTTFVIMLLAVRYKKFLNFDDWMYKSQYLSINGSNVAWEHFFKAELQPLLWLLPLAMIADFIIVMCIKAASQSR